MFLALREGGPQAERHPGNQIVEGSFGVLHIAAATDRYFDKQPENTK